MVNFIRYNLTANRAEDDINKQSDNKQKGHNDFPFYKLMIFENKTITRKK